MVAVSNIKFYFWMCNTGDDQVNICKNSETKLYFVSGISCLTPCLLVVMCKLVPIYFIDNLCNNHGVSNLCQETKAQIYFTKFTYIHCYHLQYFTNRSNIFHIWHWNQHIFLVWLVNIANGRCYKYYFTNHFQLMGMKSSACARQLVRMSIWIRPVEWPFLLVSRCCLHGFFSDGYLPLCPSSFILYVRIIFHVKENQMYE